MSYEGPPYFRWVKMYKGTRYRVSCEQLGAMVYTKEATASLANEWWRQKQAELGGTATARQRQTAEAAAEVVRLEARLAAGTATRDILRGLSEEPQPVREAVAGAVQAAHRAVTAVPEAPPTNLTAAAQAERFLTVERLRGKAAGTWGDLAFYVRRLVAETVGNEADVRSINEQTVTSVYTWLRQGDYSPTVQRRLFNYFRRFVRFLWSENVASLPRNLDARTFTFGGGAQKIPTYEVAEVRSMLAGLPKRLRLYALLALNCGMYSSDIAEIRHTEYKEGRICRKRTKTKDSPNAPGVCYRLWAETKALLDSYPRTHPEYVLTSKTGTPLYSSRIEAGKRVKYDLVGLQYRRGRGEGRAAKPPIPLKMLRKVAATLLESHPVYGRLTGLYLGHSPASVKERHYAAPPQALFDEAIAWLRQQILG